MPENEKQTNKERLKDITDSIERGIQDLFQSDKYAAMLIPVSSICLSIGSEKCRRLKKEKSRPC